MDKKFAGNRQLDKLSLSGNNYAVIFPDSLDTYEYLGFKERIQAWRAVDDIAGHGLYCYMVDLCDSDYHVIAYLSGFCNRR